MPPRLARTLCRVDATLRAARLLGRAGRWTEGIQLCESMPAPEARLVAAEPYLLSYVLRHLAFHELEGPAGDRALGADLAWQSLTLRLACGAMPEAAAQ